MEANTRTLGLSNAVNLAPGTGGINLCSLVMGDKGLLRTIVGEMRTHPDMVVSPYAVTTDFLHLITKLKGMGLDFTVPEKPADESQWTVPYLDSKVGFRTEMLKLGDKHRQVRIPEGFVAMDAAEAQQMAEWFYTRGQSCVLKSNFGESGWGVKILRKEEYSSFAIFRRAVSKFLKGDVIWKDTSIVVEKFINPDIEIAGGSPSTEIQVTDSGISFTYYCGQVIKEGAFFGVEIGKGALSDSLSGELLFISNILGNRYWELGYRGYFDIDFIVSKTGEIYVTETNTRRTGGTHVYDAAKFLFGEGYREEAYLLSHDSFVYGTNKMGPQELLEKIGSLLYPMDGRKTGVIVTLVSEWKPILGYIVIASDRLEGQNLQRRLLSLFGK